MIFLKNKKFAGGIRPTVYVRTILYSDKEIDVIIIKNTKNTPYYLAEDFQGVYKGNIYTRIGDTNTPKNATADIDKVEYLWRKRFGIDLLPTDKVKMLLQNPKNWLPIQPHEKYLGKYYCKQYPEFTIKYELDEKFFNNGRIDQIEQEMFWLNKLPRALHHVYLYNLEIKYHSTILFWTLAISADNIRFERTFWEKEYLFENNSGIMIFYIYIEKDSLRFLLDEWLNNKQDTAKRTESLSIYSSLKPELLHSEYTIYNPYSVVPVFEDKKERNEFIKYVEQNKDKFLDIVGDIKDINYINPDWINYLCKVGETLTKWLDKWRRQDKIN